MPVQANITLNSKVYTPRGTSGGISTWSLAGDTSFGGAQSDLTESVRGPDSEGLYHTQWILFVPKVATVDSTCACVGSSLGKGKASIKVDMPSNFTAAEKADFAARIQAAVATAVFGTSVSVPEGSWG